MNIAKATFLCFATPFYNSVSNQTPQKMGAPMAPPSFADQAHSIYRPLFLPAA
jgi:hypothetical protein